MLPVIRIALLFVVAHSTFFGDSIIPIFALSLRIFNIFFSLLRNEMEKRTDNVYNDATTV